jgi:hypothetical protein
MGQESKLRFDIHSRLSSTYGSRERAQRRADNASPLLHFALTLFVQEAKCSCVHLCEHPSDADTSTDPTLAPGNPLLLFPWTFVHSTISL